MMLRMRSSRRGLPGLVMVMALALPFLVAGCASRSVSASAQDVALMAGPTQPPPPQAEQLPPQEQPGEARRAQPVEQPPPQAERPATQEQPVEARRAQPVEQPPPQAERPATQEQPVEARRAQPSEQPPPGTPETPPAETRVTEPELAPPPAEKPPEVAAVAPGALPPTGPPAIEPTVEIAGLSDVFFDFDKFVLREDARPALEEDAGRLKQQNGWKLLIEGHCDERGTLAYNLVLGERRAQAVRNYLANLGLLASQMNVMSFGKERPFCLDHSEACWQQNRRAHLVREP